MEGAAFPPAVPRCPTLTVVDVRLLGPVEVVAGPVTLALGGPRHRMVLAMLALAAPDVVSTDRLVDGLWGESPPDKPLPTLQVFVHKLRRALAEAGVADPRTVLESRPPGYRLAVDHAATDVGRFEDLLTVARTHTSAGETAAAVAAFDEALGLWRGRRWPMCETLPSPSPRRSGWRSSG